MNTRKWFAFALASVAALTLSACGPKSPEEKLRRSGELAQMGDYQGALDLVLEVKESTKDDATWSDATMDAGTFYILMADYEGAMEQFQQVADRLNVTNENPILAKYAFDARLNLMRGYSQSGKPEKSRELLLATSDTLTLDNPMMGPLYVAAAMDLAQQGDLEAADRHFRALLAEEKDQQSLVQLLQIAGQMWMAEGNFLRASDLYVYTFNQLEEPWRYDMLVMGGLILGDPLEEGVIESPKARRIFKEVLEGLAEEEKSDPDDYRGARIAFSKANALAALGGDTEARDILTSMSKNLMIDPYIRVGTLTDLQRFYLLRDDKESAADVLAQLESEFGELQQVVQQARMMQEQGIEGYESDETTAPSTMEATKEFEPESEAAVADDQASMTAEPEPESKPTEEPDTQPAAKATTQPVEKAMEMPVEEPTSQPSTQPASE